MSLGWAAFVQGSGVLFHRRNFVCRSRGYASTASAPGAGATPESAPKASCSATPATSSAPSTAASLPSPPLSASRSALICALATMSAHPSTFVPFHLAGWSASSCVASRPVPQLASLLVDSAMTASPVASSFAARCGMARNFCSTASRATSITVLFQSCWSKGATARPSALASRGVRALATRSYAAMSPISDALHSMMAFSENDTSTTALRPAATSSAAPHEAGTAKAKGACSKKLLKHACGPPVCE
mmetsp:Transcript_11084/g.38504  ORF Transcript_11084/g.38504 Transcript_11084/m.38504 type:complete len:247 (+) Transcript_11084:1065-1805(+)